MSQRFYKTVGTAPADPDGHAVLLDGRPVRTPKRRSLALPTAALADLVAAEWAAQGEAVKVDEMPVTRLATTVVDLMPDRSLDAEEEVLGFAATDLLCYRVASPADLARRQDECWQPWLDWAHRHLDARLDVTRGIEPITQPEASLAALRVTVARLDAWRLTGVHATVTLTGSLVLGLAVERGRLDAGQAFKLSLLDELYGIERWGQEQEQQRRQRRLRRDLEAAHAFLLALPRAA